MLKTIQSHYIDGKIEFESKEAIPDHATVYVSFQDANSENFFSRVSEPSIDEIWDNNEDDVYEQLLKK